MSSAIDEVAESWKECEANMLQYYQDCLQANWDAFDWGITQVEKLADELEFVRNLMSVVENDLFDKETGRFTTTGLTTAATHAAAYDIYMDEAEAYAKKVQEIEAEIANNPANSWLIDQKEEYLSLQRQAIENANEEKKSVQDLYSEMYDRILSILQELIEKRKEWLSAGKDLYDFSNTVKEQTKTINDYQKQLLALANDDSEESKSRRQTTSENLKKSEQELEETFYDRWISDQEQILDQLYDESERIFNERLDQIDLLLSEIIEWGNSHSELVKTTIETETAKVGYTISDEVRDIWTGNNVLTSYYNNMLSGTSTISTTISSILKILQDKFTVGTTTSTAKVSTPSTKTSSTSSVAKDTTTTTTTTSTKKTIAVGSKVNAGSAPIYWDSTGKVGPWGSHQYYSSDPVYYVTRINGDYACVKHHTQSAEAGWFKISDLTAMATGGYTGNYEGAAYLHKKERVLSSQQTEAFDKLVYDIMPMMVDQIKSAQLHDLGLDGTSVSNSANNYAEENSSNTVKDLTINFNLPNVTDSSSFMKELQSNKEFRELVTSMVLDPVVGKGKLRKNSVKLH